MLGDGVGGDLGPSRPLCSSSSRWGGLRRVGHKFIEGRAAGLPVSYTGWVFFQK